MNLQPRLLGPQTCASRLRVCKEEVLLRRESIDRRSRLTRERFLKSVIRDGYADDVGEIFTERELAVHMQVVEHGTRIVLSDELISLGGEPRAVIIGPPLSAQRKNTVLAWEFNRSAGKEISFRKGAYRLMTAHLVRERSLPTDCHCRTCCRNADATRCSLPA